MDEDNVYKCKRCGYSSAQKGNVITHLKRKRVCSPTVSDIPVDELLKEFVNVRSGEFVCEWCNERYAYNNSLLRHVRKCSARLQQQQEDDNGDGSAQHINNITNITTNNNNQNNINIQNNIHNHNHYMIVPFGSEDTEFLFEDRFRKIMAKCVAEPMKGVQHIIKLVHFNQDRPEYQNICIPNISRPHALCYDGTSWTISNKDDVLKKIVQDSASTMYAFVDERSKELSKKTLETFDIFDCKRDNDDPVLLEALQKEAEITIINNQDEVGVRDKARKHKRERKQLLEALMMT